MVVHTFFLSVFLCLVCPFVTRVSSLFIMEGKKFEVVGRTHLILYIYAENKQLYYD
jgi:hypothetical protein